MSIKRWSLHNIIDVMVDIKLWSTVQVKTWSSHLPISFVSFGRGTKKLYSLTCCKTFEKSCTLYQNDYFFLILWLKINIYLPILIVKMTIIWYIFNADQMKYSLNNGRDHLESKMNDILGKKPKIYLVIYILELFSIMLL